MEIKFYLSSNTSMNQVTVSRSVCPFIPSSIPCIPHPFLCPSLIHPSSTPLSTLHPFLRPSFIHSSVHPSSIPLSTLHPLLCPSFIHLSPSLIHPSSSFIPLSIPHPPLCLSLSLFLSLHPSVLSNPCLPSVHHSICPSLRPSVTLSVPLSIAHPSYHLSLHFPIISQSERCPRHCT